MLLMMTAGTLSADTFDINVNFGAGITGTGSFNTDGTCDPCTAGAGMTNFTFTVDDDTFTEAEGQAVGLMYERIFNTLFNSAFIVGGDNPGDMLRFQPFGFSTLINFVDADDAPASATATAKVSAVPEPTSLVLLAGVVAWVLFDLKRRFRKKSVIHTLHADRFADRGTI